MKEIIKKVLKEEIIKEANITTVSENSFFNGVLNLMDNPPYLPLLYSMELSKEDIVKVFELMYRNLGEERTKVAFSEDGSISVIDPVFHNPLYYEEPHLRFKDTIYWEKWDYWPDVLGLKMVFNHTVKISNQKIWKMGFIHHYLPI
jgi:hypothetical protein